LRCLSYAPRSIVAVPRLSVRTAAFRFAFPLARPLPSTTSAAFDSALFGGFASTTGLSDSPCPFMSSVRPFAFLDRPTRHAWAAMGSPGSRAGKFHACPGSRTPRGREPLAITRLSVLPSPSRDKVGAPDVADFGALSPGLHVPLSTLRQCPHEHPRMTRGQSGSLYLPCTGPTPALSCRFIPAHPVSALVALLTTVAPLRRGRTRGSAPTERPSRPVRRLLIRIRAAFPSSPR